METKPITAPLAPVAPKEKPWKLQPELALAPDCNCSVHELKGGDAVVIFRITDAVTLRRLKLRANEQDLAMHLWENLLKRVVSSYVY